MSKLIAREYQNFEQIKQDTDGEEFWFARELAPVLEYVQWRNFSKVIDRAMLACKNSGFDVSDHFVEIDKMVEMPVKPRKDGGNFGFADLGKTKKIIDYKLSRYACYLVVQNGAEYSHSQRLETQTENSRFHEQSGAYSQPVSYFAC